MAESAESRRWFRRLALPVRIISAIVAILFVGGVAYWIYINVRTCGPGIERIDGKCIGVTDGAVVLTPDLADVLGKIRQENKWVDDNNPQGKVASVAYLTALPESPPNGGARSSYAMNSKVSTSLRFGRTILTPWVAGRRFAC